MAKDFKISTKYDSEGTKVQMETPDLKRWNLTPQEAKELARELEETAENYDE